MASVVTTTTSEVSPLAFPYAYLSTYLHVYIPFEHNTTGTNRAEEKEIAFPLLFPTTVPFL